MMADKEAQEEEPSSTYFGVGILMLLSRTKGCQTWTGRFHLLQCSDGTCSTESEYDQRVHLFYWNHHGIRVEEAHFFRDCS